MLDHNKHIILVMLLHIVKDMDMDKDMGKQNQDTMVVVIDIKDQEDLIALVVIRDMATDIYENIYKYIHKPASSSSSNFQIISY